MRRIRPDGPQGPPRSRSAAAGTRERFGCAMLFREVPCETVLQAVDFPQLSIIQAWVLLSW